MFSVPLRGDKANGVHRGMNFIRPVKDIEAMEIEVQIFSDNRHKFLNGIL